MSANQIVVLLDRGNLSDVRDALTSLRIPYSDRLTPGHPAPKLLLTTPEEAHRRSALGDALHVVIDPDGPTDIACDFWIQHPVSADLLRLLVARAKHGGPERRLAERVAIGASIEIECNTAPQSATLAQISMSGCGLVTHETHAEGSRLCVRFPEALTAPRQLALWGDVRNVRPILTADGQTYDVAVRFDALDEAERVTLRALMAGRGIHFGSYRRMPLDDEKAAQSTSRAVLGCRIGPVTMQLERDPVLALGDCLEFTVYDGAVSEPVTVRGRIAQEIDDRGFLVQFESVAADSEQQLREMESRRQHVAGSPDIVIVEVAG